MMILITIATIIVACMLFPDAIGTLLGYTIGVGVLLCLIPVCMAIAFGALFGAVVIVKEAILWIL